MDYIVQSGMAAVATFTPPTAEPVCGETVHLTSTMVAGMGPTQRGSQAEAYCCPDGVVIHSQAEG